jgi:3-methyladenine DNA glycosylase AlkD
MAGFQSAICNLQSTMPPIDLPTLRARAAAIAEKFSDPPALLAAVHSLLEDYADRSHRASPKLTDSSPQNTLKTPMPVVRAVITALRQRVKAQPQAALAVVEGLWAAGTREERRVAAGLLGFAAPLVPAEALASVERSLATIESGETAEALAHYGFAPLLLADPATHLRNIERWVTQPQKWARCFGLAALSVLAKHKTWDDVPSALDVINSVMGDAEPEVRKAAAVALSDLIPKSTAEVSRFLREQAARPNHNTHLIVRAVMLKLGPDDQAEIIKVMRE